VPSAEPVLVVPSPLGVLVLRALQVPCLNSPPPLCLNSPPPLCLKLPVPWLVRVPHRA
jgi:hypothetical protein